MWSLSMFVTTRMDGERFKNERLYSHASAIKYFPVPPMKLLRALVSKLPMTTVWLSPPAIAPSAIIPVVVVFPCVPETATVYLFREIAPRNSGDVFTGIPRRREIGRAHV